MKSYFGHGNFRGKQRYVVAAALRGEDVFVLMPTGAWRALPRPRLHPSLCATKQPKCA